MADDDECWAGPEEGEESELGSSELDDIPLVLSESDASPGPSTPPSARSERATSARGPGISDANDRAASSDAAAAKQHEQQQQQQEHVCDRPRPVPPRFALQLPAPSGGRSALQLPVPPGATADGGDQQQQHQGSTHQSLRQMPRVPQLIGFSDDAAGGGGGPYTRGAKPPPLALFVTSASSPAHSPARGPDAAAGRMQLNLQRPGMQQQQQQQQAAAKGEVTIQVQLLLPAFDLVLPAASRRRSSDAAEGAAPAGAPDPAAVRDAIARALGVLPQHLLFHSSAQGPSDLPWGAPAATAPGGTGASDGNCAGNGWPARGAASSSSSRLASSSSSNSRGGACAAAPPPPPGPGLVVVSLSDGACSFCLADLEDSLRRAELAAAALKEQQAAHEALQAQLVLRSLEVAERAADAQRLRQGAEGLQRELQRLK
ncbi:hypothetical protein MNEG_11996 [Monoraphidium neglectum]|uniref:Uncharacterized protein n=1 Tax=Monoraphidium neglectum TaxID=145388 RepID=A0A0D2LWX4_9CHLO|nr:hypothetical protein MNEG_11996 [Monoraphidium neglectum]KIY95964.1 hypothetical protein MNEG_11996 [Monoraphidium neglectum]|eukprot:XP_013894984.1 hypothetical protein MNEG_11996 [Monoraphidium neglectum]